jgi:hypothetical protein
MVVRPAGPDLRGGTIMLTREQIAFYQTNGYLAVENVIREDLIAQARAVVEEFVQKSSAVTESDGVFDLEPGHTPETPRLRRLKEPVQHHPIFDALMRAPKLLDAVEDLIGPGVRFQAS